MLPQKPIKTAYSAGSPSYRPYVPTSPARMLTYHAYPSRLRNYRALPDRVGRYSDLYADNANSIARIEIEQAVQPASQGWTYRLRRWSLKLVIRMKDQLQLRWSQLIRL